MPKVLKMNWSSIRHNSDQRKIEIDVLFLQSICSFAPTMFETESYVAPFLNIYVQKCFWTHKSKQKRVQGLHGSAVAKDI